MALKNKITVMMFQKKKFRKILVFNLLLYSLGENAVDKVNDSFADVIMPDPLTSYNHNIKSKLK